MRGRAGLGKAWRGKVMQAWHGTTLKRKEAEMVYKWKTNNHKADPNVAGEVFRDLEASIGLTSTNVVEVSRPKDAPLHNEFEWRDDVAAERFREEQARLMIANLYIVVEEPKVESVRAFLTLERSQKQKSEFINIETIMADDEKRNRLFDVALRELNSFRRKYSGLAEFSELFTVIDKLNEKGEPTKWAKN